VRPTWRRRISHKAFKCVWLGDTDWKAPVFVLPKATNTVLGQGQWVVLTSAPIATRNWRAPRGNQWAVTIGGGIGRVLRLGLPPLAINNDRRTEHDPRDPAAKFLSQFRERSPTSSTTNDSHKIYRDG
jgi:hypothetical protein